MAPLPISEHASPCKNHTASIEVLRQEAKDSMGEVEELIPERIRQMKRILANGKFYWNIIVFFFRFGDCKFIHTF